MIGLNILDRCLFLKTFPPLVVIPIMSYDWVGKYFGQYILLLFLVWFYLHSWPPSPILKGGGCKQIFGEPKKGGNFLS